MGGRFRPVYLFWGPEEYLLRHAVSLLKERAVAAEARPFNIVEMAGRDSEAAQIIREANTYPMMAPRRLVMVWSAEELGEEEQELLADYARNPQDKTVLLLIAGKIDRNRKLYKAMTESACAIEFAPLKGAALERWATSHLARHKLRLAPAAIKKLVELAGSDLQSLANEIEKLMLFAGTESGIPDSAIEDLVRNSRLHTIFELTAALGRRDAKSALRLLGNLLEAGEAAAGIVSMMARHYRQMIVAQELIREGRPDQEIGRAAQVPGFVLPEFLRQARALSSHAARDMYQRLARIDYSLKSTNPDARMLLEHLICSLQVKQD
jgi:DNA polymerase III subunit delta